MDKYFSLEDDYLPWVEHSQDKWDEQASWHAALCLRYGAQLDSSAFISKHAKLYGINLLVVGANSVLAAGCLVRETWLTMGCRCSINTGSYLQGKITLGDDVRIAPGAKIIGMNHIFEQADTPISEQGLSYQGIIVEDDVWIGAGAIVLDGVHIGAHSVIGAGSVVTKSFPPYSVVAGNPAKRLRDRRSEGLKKTMAPKLVALVREVKAQVPAILERHTTRVEGKQGFTMHNEPGQPESTRAYCDAVEIITTLDLPWEPMRKQLWTKMLQRLQTDQVDYDVLTVGYGLKCMGALPEKPFAEATIITDSLEEWLGSLPWSDNPWGAGAQIDHFATALYFNAGFQSEQEACQRALLPLFGWLATHQDGETGLWGVAKNQDLHLLVNGFYRLSRGTYAQYGVPLPQPEKIIESVLWQSKNRQCFGDRQGNACDVLDIIHPLWLCAKQTRHRLSDGREWAATQLERLINAWMPGEGFSFELDRQHPATLQGTEMGLAIIWHLCDYLGLADNVEYLPKGVHSPFPASKKTLFHNASKNASNTDMKL